MMAKAKKHTVELFVSKATLLKRFTALHKRLEASVVEVARLTKELSERPAVPDPKAWRRGD
jgi:hypothetical protein